MKRPSNIYKDHVFMNCEEFDKLSGGTYLVDSSGREVIVMARSEAYHSEYCVFDPSDGIICHFSWFSGLRII